MKKNYKAIVSYDGTRYFGWEHQPNTDMTIQGKLEAVLNTLAETEGFREESERTGKIQKITVIGAGRTDAGVHARAMTCNFLLDTELDEVQLQAYMNRYLPEDISVNDLHVCADRFHSRFKAMGKTYRYTCWYGPSKPVFDRRYVYILDNRPDTERMRRAAEYMTGLMDYRSFCGNTRMKKSTVRAVDSIRIEENGNYLRFYFHGSGFLQNMVRIMTGTLLEVGSGSRDPEDIPKILAARDRAAAGFTAPAKGLCLMKVDY